MTYDLAVLSDPTVFAMGRLPAVSDHDCYRNEAEAARGESSLRRSLNGRWRFHYAQTPAQRPLGFERDGASLDGFGEIEVPGHIQLQGYGMPHYVNTQYPWDGHERLRPPEIPQRYNPVGSYVTFFRLPESWRGMDVTLTFHGVESAFFVWLNGTLLGYGEDGFTPSRFDLTPLLREGENKLAVEVFRFCSGSWLEDQDFWRFSGIFREVELQALPPAHVEDVFAHALPEEDLRGATLSAECRLRLPQQPVTLAGELIAPDGGLVDRFEMAAATECAFARRIAAPLLWSAERPHLYTLRLSLKNALGETLEVAQTQVGFRRFTIKDGRMLLNGKRILFHGVNRHEFDCRRGRAVTEQDMLWDVQTLKRNNINAVRCSHYPNSRLWYKLCDRYGIYLIDEANLEAHGTWQFDGVIRGEGALPGDREEWREAALDRARSMLERDKNHPSVLLWSCGNESYGGKNLFEMSRFFRSRDPDRPVHYEGVYHDRRYSGTSDVESRMYPPAAEVAAYLDAHRDKPFVLCEYSHAMGNSCGGLREYLALEDRYPQYQGGFLWDWIDQALERTMPNGKRRLCYGGDFGDQPTDRHFCGNGLVFADRTPTPKLQEVRFLYQNVRLLPQRDGVRLENRSLFDGLEGFYLRWALLWNGERVRAGKVEDVEIPAGESRWIPLPVCLPREPGEWTLGCELCLKEAAPWAEAGYPLMGGQAVLRTESEAKPRTGAYRVHEGDVNAGAHGEGFEALFSFKEGGPVLYRRPGQLNAINFPPALSLFRAPTDNDNGNGDAQKAALWQAISLFSKPFLQSMATENGRLRVTYGYDTPIVKGLGLEAHYQVLPDGALRAELRFAGAEGQPELPCFGLLFRLPRELRQVRYYGLGPEENGVDRCTGAMLGIYETTADANLTPYLRPQFCGNRAGVRWLELTDEQGRGLRVRMENEPLEVTVLPYSPMELMSALHPDELPQPAYTWLDVALKRRGVGGDDSWGAPVLPAYGLSSGQPLRLAFVLELI